MNIPTIRTIARLLAPWRAIRRLERRNKMLSDALANPTLTGMAIHRDNATIGAAGPGPQMIAGMFLALLQDNPKAVNYLQLTFGSSEGNILITVQRPGGATPDELRAQAVQEARSLRMDLLTAKREAEQLWAERDTAREAVRRLTTFRIESVVQDVRLWATRDGMTGPLPPLPEWLARREQVEGEAPASASDLEPGL